MVLWEKFHELMKKYELFMLSICSKKTCNTQHNSWSYYNGGLSEIIFYTKLV